MIFAIGVIVFIVLLVISVAWHELGHLLPAKLFKVPVSQYMVGFGPTLWSKKVGETEYGIKWLLLGGYIRMIGMYSPNRSPRAAKSGWRANLADAAREATRDELAEVAAGSAAKPAAGEVSVAVPAGPAPGTDLNESVEDASVAEASQSPAAEATTTGAAASGGAVGTASGKAAQDVASRAFYRLSAPRKLVVMLGGPTMNLILALVLLVVALSVIGVYEPSTTIASVTQCVTEAGESRPECEAGTIVAPAKRAGLEVGDKIVGWDGQAINDWYQFLDLVAVAPTEPTVIAVERDGRRLELEVTPMEIGAGTSAARSLIGISAGRLELAKKPVTAAPVALWEQVAGSAKLYAQLPVSVWNTLSDMLQGKERSPDSPASIVGIARLSGEIGQVDPGETGIDPWRLRWGIWLQLGASVNIALWLFNLLPLLPLDGGHVANALYEGARRTVARMRGRPDPGPADSARLMPLTYVVVGLLILMTVILVAADVFNPLDI
ncbi:MAG: site-2 protease family protein [Bifidobacteriaceae bacterium]|jgi:membrane-associated protease RseP (regulator of RpoE activity)|nr:site-2 protease family protein [Bifidobacteriaceae bacterium]